MLDFAKFPAEKAVHLVTKAMPGLALLLVYDSRNPGSIAKLLSLPYLGYATRLGLFIGICFVLGYTLSTFLSTLTAGAAGAIGALWGNFTRGKHPYKYQTAPWRDPKWRAAYISRYGSDAPKDLILVVPSVAAEYWEQSQPFSPGAAEGQQLAESITLQINSQLKSAVEVIANDIEWHVCYNRMKLKVLFEKPLEAIEEVMGQLDSEFSITSVLVLFGTALSSQFRKWWIILPATSWLIVGALRFFAKTYQIAQTWGTYTEQIEMLKSGK